MKKQFFTLLVLLLATVLAAKANPVDMRTVREVAVKFVNANAKVPLRGTEDLQLVTTYRTESNDAAFHIFNAPNGFVIVSADDCATPILGYSDEGRPFDLDNIPIQLQGYLQGFVEQIQYGIENHVKDEITTQQWEMVRSMGRLNNNRDGEAVEPLITTQWGQTGVYGSMCPNGIVGCVGVAVAQVMNYWQYPEKGVGYVDYLGIQAFFNETTYHWDSLYLIPDALPTLMYHAAIGSWSRFLSEATGSTLDAAQLGMVNYFDYNALSYFANKDDYFNSQWIAMIKANLDNGIPVLYRGDISNGGGHAWVCDGYDENYLFHMNWGWEGFDDGWFLLNALNAGGWSITGGGAVFDLVPMNSPLLANFEYAIEGTNTRMVHFYDFSKNAPDSYFWDFGDGNTSTLLNPTHLYDTTGIYTITLTIGKADETSSLSQTIEIKDNLYFLEITSNLAGLFGSGIAVDYDMDGLQDLLWFGGDEFTLYKNRDSISYFGVSFEKKEEFPSCEYTSNFTHKAEVVDFSNTNAPSVLYWGIADGSRWSYLKNVEKMLVNDTAFKPEFRKTMTWSELVEDYWGLVKSFVVLDYNNDGLMDVAVGNKLYKNIGNGLFLPIETNFQHDIVSWIDVDKDGDVDIISTGGVYLNDDDWHFQYVHTPSGSIGALDDFDGDSQMEMISAGLVNSSVYMSYVYEMGEGLSFVVSDSLVKNADPAYYKTHADVNNDGLMDIIGGGDGLFNYDGDTVLYTDLEFSLDVRTGVWIDYNADCSLDMMIGNEILGDKRTYLYKNIHSNNLPPTAPTNLFVETMGNTAFLHWDASMDDHTHSGSLTYNIAVGSAPDSCDIYSPLSDLETGKRYAVGKGNAGLGTLWRINDLPNGTYYWRVQAIDQAFVGSPFSEMGSFTISGNNLPPAMAPIAKDCYMNKPNTFTREEFLEHYYDRDKDPLQSIIITQLPSQGTLFLNGNAVAEGQCILNLDLGELYYETTMLGDDAFKLKPFDGTDYSDYETTISFHTTIFEPVWKLDDVSGDVAWGDYNNDGHLDFATTWGVYKNENGDFTQILDTVPAAEHVFWADVNDDGLLDAVLSETVLLNAGNDSFVWQYGLSNQDGELSDMADANNDNKVDYLITSMDESLTTLYFNTGNGFAEDSAYRNIPTYRDGKLKFADYNNDGMADFAITGWTNDERETSLYKNSGFDFDKIETVLPEWGTGALDWGDYDNDGDLDLIVCGYNGNEYKTAIYNNNHGTMSLVTTETLPGVIRGQVKWMDYNNDGLLDILLVGYDGNTVCYLYKNTGFLSFYQIPTNQIGITPLWFSNVAIADFDGDGYQDVLLSGSDQNRDAHTYLVRNSYGAPTSTTNIVPETPSNLQCEVTGNKVRLTWNKGSDNTTPQASITYNVYIRNEDNDEFLVSPLSDVQTGFHKLANRGNCGINNFIDINSLDAGTYYWSVQSIDNGLMSSAFVPEQSFTVTCNMTVAEIYDTVHCVYYWNGEYFLNSTIATGQFTTSEGCDSTAIIHVQVLQDTCWNPIYVTESGGGLHNGDSWENAMGDLQKAIDLAAMHGSSIWVKQGTYKGDTNQENAFHVYNGVSIYGGFVGNEPADFDINLRNPMSHPTILDGQSSQRVLNSNDDGVNELHIIDGFVLQDGKSSWYSGALLGEYSILRNCIIKNNECIKESSHGVIQGGIVVNSVITRNTMSWIGVRNSILLNCVLANNYDVANAVSLVIARNCIIMDNVNPIWGDTTDALYCAMVGEYFPDGNLVVSSDNVGDDPNVNYVRFVDPSNDDYRLQPSSACIDAGSMEELDLFEMYLPPFDFQGWPRILNNTLDMGAYEYYSIPTVVTYDTICEGESYSFHDSIYDSTGVYSQHVNQNPTLDTLFMLYLQVNSSYDVDLLMQMQDGGLEWNGQTFTEPGVYTFESHTEHGCDSIVNLIIYDDMLTLCNSDLPYPYGDTVFGENTTNGLYPVSIEDREVSLYVSINPAYIIYDTIAVCSNWHYDIGNGFVYDPMSDDYILTSLTDSGCDSIVHLHIVVNPSYYLHFHDTIPSSVGYFANGFYAPAEETYNRQYWAQTRYLETDCGCDSIRSLQLTITGAPIRYVTANGTGDGTTWANATDDLQAAIDAMESEKGNVWVAQGTYYGDGVSSQAFLLRNNVYVFGGFVGNEPDDYDITLRDFSAHPTILDGQNAQRTVEKAYSYQSIGDYTAVMDGFVIQNGFVNGNGGNVYGSWETIVRNCILKGGNAEQGGGAAYATLENCIVADNYSYWESGIFSCTAANCVFANNEPSWSLASNSTAINCIFWNNGGFNPYGGNNILYSAIEGQTIEGEGNISLASENDGNDPDANYVRFVDPENGDFRLSCGSACINMGTPDISELGLPEVDLQGNPRVMDGRIDMGAYEFDPSGYINHTVVASVNPEGTGSVSGEGEYMCGQICTLTATPDEGYTFINWTKDGAEVSTEATYSFTVIESATYVANFGLDAFHFTTTGNWSTASNWQGGALPGANDIVFIDAPCQLDQNATVASLTVSDGQSLTLQSGMMLTVTGILNNTATTGLVIEGGAQIIHNVANVQATVKKSISPFNGTDDGWHLIAMPLTGSIEVESVGHLLEGEYDLYGYDESTAYWMNSKHPVDGFTALEAAKGYLYANGEEVTLEFSGNLQNSSTPVTVPLSYTDGANLAGFNLVGNPFPCNAYLDREYYMLKADGTDIIPEPIPADTPIPPCTAVFVKAEAEGETVEFTRMMP